MRSTSPVEHRLLVGTSLDVSRLCLGTMTFGGQTDEAAGASMVDLCLDFDVNCIDTANKYHDGLSEQLLGRILAGRRDKFILASKVFGKMGDGPDQSGLSQAAIFRAIDESLKRLRTDFLDIYYLHQPDYSVPLEETLGAMDHLVRGGKVRCVGVSNFASWQICRALWLAETNGYQPVAVTQPMYNLLARGIEHELLPMCRELGVSTVAYNPLAGGLLTGKHNPGSPQPGTRFDGNQMYLDRYWHPTNFQAIHELEATVRESRRGLVSVALGWLLHHTSIDCIIVGASTLGHLQENLEGSQEGALTPALLAACDKVWDSVRGVTPKYNR